MGSQGRVKRCHECGAVQGKGRSVPDHRRLFALIRKAYFMWPHDHKPNPTSEEHLRAWLLCAAKWHVVETIDIDFSGFAEYHHISPELAPIIEGLVSHAAASAVRAAAQKGMFAFTKIHADGIDVYKPRSMDFNSIPTQKEFNDLRDKITEIIEIAIGQSAEMILTARAA